MGPSPQMLGRSLPGVLVASIRENLLLLLRDLGALDSLAASLEGGLLLGEVGGGLDLTLALQALDEVLVLPADVRGEVAQLAEAALRADAQHLEAVWDNHALLAVKWVRDALEALQAVEGRSAASGLVRDHAANGTPQDLGRRPVVQRSSLRVRVHALSAEFRVLQLVAVEGARDVYVLSAHADDPLAVQQLLGDGGSQATEEVPSAIYDNLLGERHGDTDECS